MMKRVGILSLLIVIVTIFLVYSFVVEEDRSLEIGDSVLEEKNKALREEERVLEEESEILCQEFPVCNVVAREANLGPRFQEFYECFNLAVDMEDVKICGCIENQFARNECYNRVANRKLDFTICEKISNQDRRDWCYINIAEGLNQTSICERIVNSAIREKCKFHAFR